MFMKKYLDECRLASEEKIIEHTLSTRSYLIENSQFYSIYDLVCVENNSLWDFLNTTFQTFYKHIFNCPVCHGKGYLCESCGNNEVIFPFYDGTIYCSLCNSCSHRVCMVRKNMTCTKCVRLKKIQPISDGEEEEILNEQSTN